MAKGEVSRAAAALREMRSEVVFLQRQQAASQQEIVTAQQPNSIQQYQACPADIIEADVVGVRNNKPTECPAPKCLARVMCQPYLMRSSIIKSKVALPCLLDVELAIHT